MIRPRVARLLSRDLAVSGRFCSVWSVPLAHRPDSGGRPRERRPASFSPITEPITHDTLARIRAATRQLVDRNASAEQGKTADPGLRVPARATRRPAPANSAPATTWPT